MTETVGYQIARCLADLGVTTIFGVISIHNMPILDGIAEQGRIRFVPARGEAGAMNMADTMAMTMTLTWLTHALRQRIVCCARRWNDCASWWMQ